jgi:hypothetical protein
VAVSDPRPSLGEASERYREADRVFEEARQAVVDAVVAALRAGIPPTEVIQLSPFSAAYVRRIARDHGIPAARGGPPKRVRGRPQ